jgi:hypothetical protein
MVNIEFVGQLIDSMSEGVSRLEDAIEDNRVDDINKLKVFIFDLHRKITEAMSPGSVRGR